MRALLWTLATLTATATPTPVPLALADEPSVCFVPVAGVVVLSRLTLPSLPEPLACAAVSNKVALPPLTRT